jgi:holliday junction DNA helicase RuvA
MFAYLTGKLALKSPMQVILDVNGVGYDIQIPLKTFDKLPEKGKTTTLFIYFSFTESDGIRLFGFFTPEEKELFKALISVSKIGPKIAISVLSALTTNDFISAIHLSDIRTLSSVPGLGKKTSERLIIELKDKIGKLELVKLPKSTAESSLLIEAESALSTLGYKPIPVRNAINKLSKEHDFYSSEEIIKAVIKYLYKKNK